MPLSAYLFTGPEAGERNDAVEALRSQCRKKFGAVDEYNFYASETRLAEAVSVLEGQGLFSNATFAVYKGAELVKKKEEIELLAAAIKSVQAESTLVLVSDEISVDKKLESAVPKANCKKFWEMFENRKQEWLSGHFRRNGLSLQPKAAEAILDMVENDTESLRNSCRPFFILFEPGHAVSEADVEKVLSRSKEESAFTLFDAMADPSAPAEKRLERALEILQSLRMGKDSSAVAIIAGLSYSFRQLRLWHAVCANGVPSDFELKTKCFGSAKAKSRYRGAARLWPAAQAAAIVALLSKTDMEIRADGAALEETRLRLLLYQIVAKGGAEAAEYVA